MAFTPQEETILKSVAEKLKLQDELDKLEKQRRNLAKDMNDEIEVEQDKANVLIIAIKENYEPQIEAKNQEIKAKKDEIEILN